MNRIESETASGQGGSALEVLRGALTGLYTPRRLGLVMLLEALLLSGHVSSSWHASPDSAAYMGLGRSILAGRGYVFNHERHVTYPPLFPLLLAGQMAVLGDSYLALNAAQAGLALLCIPLAFLALRRCYGADLAFLGAGLFALSYYLWRTTSMVLSDVLFCALVSFSMLAATWAAGAGRRRWPAVVVTGTLIGACTLARVNGVVVAAGAVAAIWLGWKRRPWPLGALAAATIIVLAVAPTAIWQGHVQPASAGGGRTYLEGVYLSKPFGEMARSIGVNLLATSPAAASNLLAGFSDIPIVLNWLLPAAAIIGCVICLRKRDAVAPVTVLAMLALSLTVPGITTRHLLFLTPFLFVLVPVGITAVVVAFRRGRAPSRGGVRLVVLISAGILAAVHVGHSASRLVELRRGSVDGGHRMGSRQGWFTACEYMAAQGVSAGDGEEGPAAVLTQKPNLVHYLTGARGLTLKGTVFQLGLTDVQRRSMILEQVRRYRPGYLLAEEGHPLAEAGLAAIDRAAASAAKVHGLKLTGTITLWRIGYDANRPGTAPNLSLRDGKP